jgi:hypothetical protein
MTALMRTHDENGELRERAEQLGEDTSQLELPVAAREGRAHDEQVVFPAP